MVELNELFVSFPCAQKVSQCVVGFLKTCTRFAYVICTTITFPTTNQNMMNKEEGLFEILMIAPHCWGSRIRLKGIIVIANSNYIKYDI